MRWLRFLRWVLSAGLLIGEGVYAVVLLTGNTFAQSVGRMGEQFLAPSVERGMLLYLTVTALLRGLVPVLIRLRLALTTRKDMSLSMFEMSPIQAGTRAFALLMLLNVPVCLFLLGVGWATVPQPGPTNRSPNGKTEAFLVPYRSAMQVQGLFGTQPRVHFWDVWAVGRSNVSSLERYEPETFRIVWSRDSKVVALKGVRKGGGARLRFICLVDLVLKAAYGRQRGESQVLSEAQMARYLDPRTRQDLLLELQAESGGPPPAAPSKSLGAAPPGGGTGEQEETERVLPYGQHDLPAEPDRWDEGQPTGIGPDTVGHPGPSDSPPGP